MQRQYATQRATLGVNADDVRTEELRGREHVVAPVTLVREMVLKGEMLPFEEIEATQLAWNAKPTTITHPRNDNGDFVPASAPAQVESHAAGSLFGVEGRSASRSLQGEVWIDRERSAAVAESLDRDDPAELLLNDETIEVSVGYWYERFAADGEFEDEEFDAVQVGIQPDHLALLPNAEGECSIADGCGAGREDAAGAAMRSGLSAPLAALRRTGDRLGLNFGAAGDECGETCDDCGGVSIHNDGSGHDTPVTSMDDKDIQRLAENSAFDAETLRGWDEDDLVALEESIDASDDNGGDPSPDDLADQVADRVLDRVDERFEQYEREQTAEEREQLAREIATQTGGDPEELLDMYETVDQLETLAENVGVSGGVYAGRAGARSADGVDDDWELGANVEEVIPDE